MSADSGRIIRAPDGLFYISGIINGTRVRLLIDTGASVSILTREDARRLGLTTYSDSARRMISTAGGATPLNWIDVDNATIAGKALSNIRLAVGDSGLPNSLIGQDVLVQFKQMQITGDELLLN